ncbi:MAG: non-hydrolyzing UDP-N-acetylglucosamine 2-epimerase [Alphaproteobacteria bacterium]
MKLVTIVGARPQFIKAAVVSHAIIECGGVTERLIHTGQHYDPGLSDIFFAELAMSPPAHVLGIGSGSHGAQTGRMLGAIEAILSQEQPQAVLVYGDTNSTLAGALAAAKLAIPVAHVEAGMRCFDNTMPEEINRVLTDRLSSLLFAPSPTAIEYLSREGIAGDRVILTGDVMLDAVRHYGRRAARQSDILTRLDLTGTDYILATVHRAANTDDPAALAAIFEALAIAAADCPLILPLHPRTRAALQRDGLFDRYAGQLQLIEPLGYLDMQRLTGAATLVVTDSGGLQKEAFYHGVPCVTLRAQTEWTELVDCGWNTLAPPLGADSVAAAIARARGQRPPAPPPALYGDGTAARQIARALQTWRP